MRVVVLGSAAGGGFPQWNSNAPACRRSRSGDPAALARTQCSVAVSAYGGTWVLLNASPDLRQQIERTEVLHPREALRSTPIAAVVLTGGDVDAVGGLLVLRERQAFTVYGTAQTLQVLADNPIFGVLDRELVGRIALPVGEARAIPGTGLSVELVAVPGKVPLFQEEAGVVPALSAGEQVVGVAVSDGTATLFFVPSCAAMTPELAARLRGAAAVMFDGTLWTDDEMVRAGLGPKTGQRMGHMSVSGPAGTIAAFEGLEVRRRVLIHINNSNPVLLADSSERAAAEAAGWNVAYDGMELMV